jgi:putative transposase
MVLLAHIRAQFSTSSETYGAPRVHAELTEEGLAVGRHRVARLMRDNGLKALQKRRYKKTTDSSHGSPVTANLLDQDFACDGPDQKWGADISYIWTVEGWLYLAIVLDLYSRRIVGWATSDRLKKDLALNVLRRAITLRNPPSGLIQHTDRGSQYCSHDDQRLLKAHDIIPSMSGKGNCYDNARWKRCSRRSRVSWSGERSSRPAPPPNWPLADTSTASTIHVDDIPLWDTNRRHHSRPQWPSQSESLSTKSGQVLLHIR